MRKSGKQIQTPPLSSKSTADNNNNKGLCISTSTDTKQRFLSAAKYRSSMLKIQGRKKKKDKKLKNPKGVSGEDEGIWGSAIEKPDKRKRLDSNCVSNEGVWGSTASDETSVCGLAPIVRHSQIGKTSESCVQRVEMSEQDIYLEEGYEDLRVLDQLILPDRTDNQVPSEVEKDGGCVRARVCEGLKACCIDVQPARMIDNAHMCARGQSMSGQQELEGKTTGNPHSQQSPAKDVFTEQQATASEEVNTSDSEEANASPNNEVLSTKQQVSNSEEANGSPSTDTCKNITLVKTIYSKRKEKLLANQSNKSIQFWEARDRIEKEWIANLRVEHLHKSALVRKMHLEIEVRIVKLRAVDKEFVRKVEIIKKYLNTELKKLDSVHKAVRKEEEKLKYQWLQQAKSGRPGDAFSILPLSLNSCFNLDDLKHYNDSLLFSQVEQLQMSTTANSPSEHLLSNSSTNDTSVLPQAMQLELPIDSISDLDQTNESEGDVAPVVQLQRPVPADQPSEPGSSTHVPENSLVLQRITEGNYSQVLYSCSNDTSVLPHAMQLDLPTPLDSLSKVVQSNESQGDFPQLAVQLQRPLLTDQRLEPGSDTSVSENYLLCQQVKEVNHVLKVKEEFASICRVDQAQRVEFHDELERTATISCESLAQRRHHDVEAQHQTEMEAEDCRSIEVQQHSEREPQVGPPQPPNYREREEQHRLIKGKEHAINVENPPLKRMCAGLQVNMLSSDHGHRPANTRLDGARTIKKRRSAAQRKRREREAEQTRQCAEMKAQQALQCAEMKAQQAENFQGGTKPISRRSLAQRQRRKREARGRDMGAKECRMSDAQQHSEREAQQQRLLGSYQGAHLGQLQNCQLFENSERPRVAPAAAKTSNLPGPATPTIPPLIGVTANVYDIPHYVYPRRKS
ncbi:hypothetical protein MKW94_007191 [Papaver nudicaule]|uniref:Uncharacterized protein n=1 Tax=Papaver nudicaule TaxID=74823 RepID=A0AA41VJ23_PAPNU|nr:hypothetical protein [Papaver nudicaule]